MDSGETAVLQLDRVTLSTFWSGVETVHKCTAFDGPDGASAVVCACRGVFPFTRSPGVTANLIARAHRADKLREACEVLSFGLPTEWNDAHPTMHQVLTNKRPERQVFEWPNGCDTTVPKALRYLADHDRPQGGEQWPNAECLLQMAGEIESAVRRSEMGPPKGLHITDPKEQTLVVKLLGECAQAKGNDGLQGQARADVYIADDMLARIAKGES